MNVKNEFVDIEGIKEKLGNVEKSTSGLKTDVTSIGNNFAHLKQNLRANIKVELKIDISTLGSDVSIMDEKIKKEITDKFLDEIIEDLSSELIAIGRRFIKI